jgi:hypothetical protein
MARPRKATVDPFCDLLRKSAILEREMTTQREAMDRLKQAAAQRPHQPQAAAGGPPEGRLPR